MGIAPSLWAEHRIVIHAIRMRALERLDTAIALDDLGRTDLADDATARRPAMSLEHRAKPTIEIAGDPIDRPFAPSRLTARFAHAIDRHML